MKTIWIVLVLPLALAGCADKGSEQIPADSSVEAVAPVQVPEPAAAADSNGREYKKSLELLGTTFMVQASADGSINQLKITPTGSGKSGKQVDVEIDGSVTGAEVADLNSDGSPEIYVFVNSAGSGSYGSVVSFTLDDAMNMNAISFPELGSDDVNSKGYMGHDEFVIRDNSLVRSFRIYNEGDTNAEPTGGTRELRYKLAEGQQGWQLIFDGATDHDSAQPANLP